jgi:hypothetical protein
MTIRNTQQSPSMNKGLLAQLTLTGAAALAGSSANAQIVYTAVNENVTHAAHHFSFTTSLPGVNQIKAVAALAGVGSQIDLSVVGNAYLKIHPLSNGSGSKFPQVVKSPAGPQWSTIAGSTGRKGLIATGDENSTASFGYTKFTDGYFAFKFVDSLNGQTDYGWIETTLTSANHYLSLDVIGYAYDASGAQIPMGALPNTTPVPEPSATVALAALSALTLGAAGMRRLKALKAVA